MTSSSRYERFERIVVMALLRTLIVLSLGALSVAVALAVGGAGPVTG
jgi:hypothetical protein